MAKISLDGYTLKVKTGIMNTETFSLKDLRIVFIILPPTFNSFNFLTFSSTQNISSFFLDFLPEGTAASVCNVFSERLNKKERGLILSDELKDTKIYLVDYHNRWACFSLRDLKNSKVDLLSSFMTWRNERISKLNAWLETNPDVMIQGSFKLRMLRGEKGKEYRHPYYWAPFVLFGDGK